MAAAGVCCYLNPGGVHRASDRRRIFEWPEHGRSPQCTEWRARPRGTDIRGSLFETFSRETLVTIEDQIRDTIGNLEPRVSNLQIEASSRPDDNTFNLKVIFDISGLNVPRQSFTFLLEPTR